MTYRIKEFIKDAKSVFYNQRLPTREKIVLFLYYAKFTFQKFLYNRLGNFHSIRFLSYKISFSSSAELSLLIREIFIEDQYYFSTGRKEPVIIDCGGNIGISVIYFKHLYPEARIVVFEPVPEVFRLLEKNIADNKLKNVETRNCAIFDKKGRMPIYVREDTSLATSMIKEWRAERKQELFVETETLSSVLKDEVDLLKIDIELSENKVMEDVFRSDKLKGIREIIMEFHYLYAYKENSLAKVISILEASGFDYDIYFQRRKPERYASYLIKAKNF